MERRCGCETGKEEEGTRGEKSYIDQEVGVWGEANRGKTATSTKSKGVTTSWASIRAKHNNTFDAKEGLMAITNEIFVVE